MPVSPSDGVIVTTGAVVSAVVKFKSVALLIPAYELLELSSNAVASISI